MKKRTVFSPVHGRIHAGGRPVAKLEVVQRWQWLSVDDGVARTTTDAQGRFSFPEVSVRKLRAPKDVLIIQDLEVTHEGRKLTLWNLTRQNTDPGGELGGHPIELDVDLDQPSRELKLPVAPDALVVLSGVGTPRHPYLERWARTEGHLTARAVGLALKRFLASPEGLKGLAAFLPAIGAQRDRVAEVVSVREVQLSDGFLFTENAAGHFAVEGQPRFVGVTTRAQVTLRLASGDDLAGLFFAWQLYLPLDAEGRPGPEASFSDRWEVDTRPFVRARAEAALREDKVTALVRDLLQRAPGADFLAAFDARSAKALTIGDVALESMAVSANKDDWALLAVVGEVALKVAGRAARHRFEGYFPVLLASLGEAAYRVAPALDAPRFRVSRFRVDLAMDQATYARGEPMVLTFTVQNRMGSPQPFLTWHTPFEGFGNDFLGVVREGGEAVAYQGMMASRAPPGPDSYLTLGPGESATSKIDITEAYPVKQAGDYVVTYKPLADGVWAGMTRFSVR